MHDLTIVHGDRYLAAKRRHSLMRQDSHPPAIRDIAWKAQVAKCNAVLFNAQQLGVLFSEHHGQCG